MLWILLLCNYCFKAAGKVGEILKGVNKINGYAVKGLDAYKIGASAFQDFIEGTIRNTTTTILSISGSWTGASAGILFKL